MARKKVKAYVWTMRNGGLVQIGETMFEPSTGNQWPISLKPWLGKKDIGSPQIFSVSSKSWDGVEEAIEKYVKKFGSTTSYNHKRV